jgi:hypothetical protein
MLAPEQQAAFVEEGNSGFYLCETEPPAWPPDDMGALCIPEGAPAPAPAPDGAPPYDPARRPDIPLWAALITAECPIAGPAME